MKMKYFGLTETKLFFIGYLKNRGQGGGLSEPHEFPLGLPLNRCWLGRVLFSDSVWDGSIFSSLKVWEGIK